MGCNLLCPVSCKFVGLAVCANVEGSQRMNARASEYKGLSAEGANGMHMHYFHEKPNRFIICFWTFFK